MDSALDRRDLLKLLAASAASGPLLLTAAQPGRPLFFTPVQFALLDMLTEYLIPRDAHSPGARDAGVAAYIDKSVAEAFLPEEKDGWKNGLGEIDKLSLADSGKLFAKAGKSRQLAILTKLAAAEGNPQSPAEKFFKQLKSATAFAYYSSEIGIHKEMEYKGNVILEQFVGYDAV